MKEFKLKRTTYTDNSTIGELTLDGQRICFTLEDKVRPKGAAKVHGKTAIPAGRYQVIIDFSNAFNAIMPHVLNVPGFAGIRIHVGNRESDSLGCVLVGRKKGVDSIYESKQAYGAFLSLLQKHLKAGTVYLVIEDSKR